MDIKDKLLMLLEKVGLPTEVVETVKSELEKIGSKEDPKAVEVTKIEVSGPISPEDVDKMSEEEAKAMLKKKLEAPKPSKITDKMKSMMY